MWFGRVVPLFRFPLIKNGPLHSQSQEERLLPLPAELCVGMNTDEGTALYATYGVNPALKPKHDSDSDCQPWGEDLAGWMAIAPFPPTLFGSERLLRLGVHVKTGIDSFHQGVTKLVTEAGGAFLAMEILGCGDMGSLVLLPPTPKGSEPLEETIAKSPYVRATCEKKWRDGNGTEMPDWIDNLFPRPESSSRPKVEFEPIEWTDDRRVLIRDRQITVPYGEFWHTAREYQEQEHNNTAEHIYPEDRIKPVDYCFLARNMELPVLLALFPSRPLFQIDIGVAAEKESKNGQTGSGMLNHIIAQLSSRQINIWHVKHTYRSLLFDCTTSSKSSQDPHTSETKERDYTLRGVESAVTIVASVPHARRLDSPDALAHYLQDLRERLFHTPLSTTTTTSDTDLLVKLKEVSESLPSLAQRIESLIQDWENKHEGWEKDPLWRRSRDQILKDSLSELQTIVDCRLDDISKASAATPEFIKEVEIHGPPLFRCFFSHSARPDYDERDYIDRLKLLLESEVFEVIEGEFSLGMSTEQLSRGRIRYCDLFVSFLWPRSDFHTDKGVYLPPEWVIHEESFAIGHGLPVFRVREKSVAPPRYEHDRVDFPFMRGDVHDWSNLEQRFRQDIRQLALQILLQAKPGTPKRRVENEAAD